jgi:hypothetical protein
MFRSDSGRYRDRFQRVLQRVLKVRISIHMDEENLSLPFVWSLNRQSHHIASFALEFPLAFNWIHIQTLQRLKDVQVGVSDRHTSCPETTSNLASHRYSLVGILLLAYSVGMCRWLDPFGCDFSQLEWVRRACQMGKATDPTNTLSFIPWLRYWLEQMV